MRFPSGENGEITPWIRNQHEDHTSSEWVARKNVRVLMALSESHSDERLYLMMTEQQVVIIGGSEGIGLAVAKAARTLGARVLAVSRTREKLEAARDAVKRLRNPRS